MTKSRFLLVGRLLCALTALLTTMTARAEGLSGSGTIADPYLITNVDDWNTFTKFDTRDTYWASGTYVKLTADIPTAADIAAGKSVTTMLEANHGGNNQFQGIFDGTGHTLTINYDVTYGPAAPFSHISGATIKNLRVAGTIHTTNSLAAGVVGQTRGSSTVERVWSSVAISATYDGNPQTYHGGIATSVLGGTLTLTDCLFDGSISGDGKGNCGLVGVGFSNTHIVFNHCLQAGNISTDGYLGKTICNNSSTVDFSTCYYKTQHGQAQGIKTSATGSELQALLGDNWIVSGDMVIPIMDSKNLTIATINGLEDHYQYTGNNIEVTFSVSDDAGNPLTEGTHYTSSISPSPVIAVGTYTLTVTAKGGNVAGFYGTKSATFHVYPWKTGAIGGYCGNPAANDGKNIYYEITDEGGVKTLSILKSPLAVGTDFSMADDVVFASKDFTSAVISRDIATIGANAFNGCTSLSSILVLPETPPTLGSNAFKDIVSTAVFTVRNTAYETADGWKDVKDNSGSYSGYDFTMIVPNDGCFFVPYIDMNGQPATCQLATALTGSETELAEGWYVVLDNTSFDHQVSVTGDIHIILKDNAVMNVGTESSPVSGNGIGDAGLYNFSISIYGQSTGADKGHLKVYATGNGIHAFNGNVNCSSARLTVSASDDNQYGIYAQNSSVAGTGNINLRDAAINATAPCALYAQGGDVTVNGGQLTATGASTGIMADGSGNITLSWTNTNDFIHASSYSAAGNISIASGKTFTDGTDIYDSNTASDDLKALTDVKLFPHRLIISPNPIPSQILRRDMAAVEPEVVVTDMETHQVLTKDTHYSVTYADNTGEGTATLTVTGLDPYYSGTINRQFLVVKDCFEVGSIGYRITSPTTAAVETVGSTLTVPTDIAIPATITNTTLGTDFTVTSVDAGAFTNSLVASVTLPGSITDIKPGAFTGANNLKWIDMHDATGFTAGNTDRKSPTSPFLGVPKQALVYLYGKNPSGDNYVFYSGTDYVCDRFIIYDDLSGSQKQYQDAGDYRWAITVPTAFKAKTVANTRQLTQGHFYTTCLPYSMQRPYKLEVYELEASTDKNIGFKTLEGTVVLESYKPYLLKAKSSGTLLSATNVTVYASPAEGTMHRLWGAGPVNTGNAYLYGTMRYMGTEAPAAGGLYIMQSSGNWGLVETPQDYNSADGSGVCILPMRAYVKMGSPAAARRLTATYTSGIEEIASGEDLNTPVYNLQGMKVSPANAKGIVIIGGKKVVR